MIRHISIWIINQIACFSDSAVFDKVSTAFRNYGGHAQRAIKCPEYCLTQLLLGTIISLHFNSYLCKGKEDACDNASEKVMHYIGRRRCDFFCLLPVGVCIDAYVTIRSYVLCVSTHKLHACK